MIPTRLMILVILAALVFPAVAFEPDNLTDYRGIPAYCLIIDSTNPVVDTGDEFCIKVYMSGAGDIDFGRILVSIPQELVKDNRVVYSYLYRVTEEGRVEHRSETGTSRFQMIPTTNIYKRFNFNSSDSLILLGEAEYEKRIPYLINFTIADNAPVGDHTITMVHTYRYLDKWYLEKNELKIHVNAWYERGNFGHSHLSWQSLAIGLTVLAILVTFINQFIDIVIHVRQRRR